MFLQRITRTRRKLGRTLLSKLTRQKNELTTKAAQQVHPGGWPIEIKERAVIVTMNTDPSNKMDEKWLEDANDTLDRLEGEEQLKSKAIIFTSTGKIFSSGLDIVTLYKKDRDELEEYICGKTNSFSSTLFRFFTISRPTVAALNGHTVAGGMALALACDTRVAATGEYKIGLGGVLNVGFPYPAVPIEIFKAKLSPHVLWGATLQGQYYTPQTALEHRIIDKIVSPETLLSSAMELTDKTPPECFAAYKAVKDSLVLHVLQNLADPLQRRLLDERFVDVRFSKGSSATLERLYNNVIKKKRVN